MNSIPPAQLLAQPWGWGRDTGKHIPSWLQSETSVRVSPSLPNFFQFLTELEEQHLHWCDNQNMLWVQGGASSFPNSKLILVNSVPALQSIINQPLVQRNKHPFYFLRARTTHLCLKSPYFGTYVIWTINVMHCSSARHNLPAALRLKEGWSWKYPLLGLKRAGKWI